MDYEALKAKLSQTTDKTELHEAIVNMPFENKLHTTQLGLGIVVLLLANEANGTLDRIALSNNELASGAIQMSAKPFHEIRIPLDYEKNILIQAIQTRSYQQTNDWQHMFVPELTPQEARFNQAGAGIDCSIIYPLLCEDTSTPLGALIYSYFEPLSNIGQNHHNFMEKYTQIVSCALEALNP